MEDTINRYQIWSERRNPHAIYAQMRANDPIYAAIGPVTRRTFWFFTRYDDCVTVLKDPRFIKESDKILTEEERQRFNSLDEATAAINRHMLNLDPPDHTRLRSLVHKAFTPRIVENLRAHIAEIAEDLLNAIDRSGDQQIDLIERFAFPLPIIVIAELLGIPKEDRVRFRQWTRAIVFGNDPQAMAMASMEIIGYFNEVFAARRAEPQEDLISALVSVDEAGDKLSQQELLSMIFLLLVAGHETTVNLIGNGMLALMQHPQQQALLVENPALIKTAVEEMLRYHGPVENTLARWAAEDTEFDGHLLRRGNIVMASLMSANRDEAVFENPDTFDITREPNRHIAFGSGIHYCLGAPLARLEGVIAINALLRRQPHIALAVAPDELEWNDQIILRGMRALPVSLNGK